MKAGSFRVGEKLKGTNYGTFLWFLSNIFLNTDTQTSKERHFNPFQHVFILHFIYLT